MPIPWSGEEEEEEDGVFHSVYYCDISERHRLPSEVRAIYVASYSIWLMFEMLMCLAVVFNAIYIVI